MRRWMMWSVLLRAQEAWGETPELPDASGGIALGSLVIRAILSLGLVVALIYGAVFLLRRIMDRRQRLGGGGLIRVLGSVFIGPKQGVYLLDVLDRVLVVGVTDTSMVLLSEITDPSVVQSVECAGAVPGDETFLGHLRSLMERFGTTHGEDQDET